MKKDHFILELPERLAKFLNLSEDGEVEVTVKSERAYLEAKEKLPEKQTVSFQWFLIPSILSVLLFAAFFFVRDQKQIALVGSYSIATLVFYLGMVSGMLSFTYFFVKAKRSLPGAKSSAVYWRNFPAVLLSFSITLFLCTLVFFKIMGLVFKGVSFDLFTAAILFFLFVSIINYVMIYVALSLTPSFLINLLICVIIGGVLIAMVTNRDHLWWEYNFSFLGTGDAKNRWEFNLTLILSAVLMVSLTDYLFVNLRRGFPKLKRLALLKVLLILTALNLGGVGAFPYSNGLYGQIHNQVAANLVYLIVILIIGIRWLLPAVTKEFLTVSYLIGGVLVLICVLFQGVHYLSLTAFELLSFMLAFSWLLLLFQYLQTLSSKINDTFPAKVFKVEREEEQE